MSHRGAVEDERQGIAVGFFLCGIAVDKSSRGGRYAVYRTVSGNDTLAEHDIMRDRNDVRAQYIINACISAGKSHIVFSGRDAADRKRRELTIIICMVRCSFTAQFTARNPLCKSPVHAVGRIEHIEQDVIATIVIIGTRHIKREPFPFGEVKQRSDELIIPERRCIAKHIHIARSLRIALHHTPSTFGISTCRHFTVLKVHEQPVFGNHRSSNSEREIIQSVGRNHHIARILSGCISKERDHDIPFRMGSDDCRQTTGIYRISFRNRNRRDGERGRPIIMEHDILGNRRIDGSP